MNPCQSFITRVTGSDLDFSLAERYFLVFNTKYRFYSCLICGYAVLGDLTKHANIHLRDACRQSVHTIPSAALHETIPYSDVLPFKQIDTLPIQGLLIPRDAYQCQDGCKKVLTSLANLKNPNHHKGIQIITATPSHQEEEVVVCTWFSFIDPFFFT
jgi:hypothetical protein